MQIFVLCVAALFSLVATNAHAQDEATRQVPLPILGARVVQVLSLETRGACSFDDLDLLLTPEEPVVTFSTGCTDVTVELDGNRIVASRVPGGEDFFVSLTDVELQLPDSMHPYVPVLVSQRPGQSSRIAPRYEIEGQLYFDATGNSHPTCDECDFTFPGLAGSVLRYDRMGAVVRQDEGHEIASFSVLMQPQEAVDLDGDGQPDRIDRCPGTAAGVAVDDEGCSNEQFCREIDVKHWLGALACFSADWLDDSESRNPRDCRIRRFGCVAR